MGKINKLFESCKNVLAQPIKPKDTDKVEIVRTESFGCYIIDVGVILNSNRFEAIKNRIQARQTNGIKITVRQAGPREIECTLDSPEIVEKVKAMASFTAGEMETMLSELKNIKE